MLLNVLTAIWAWKHAGRAAQSLAAANLLMTALHALAWLIYGSANSLHAVCAAIGTAVMLPMVLRSKRQFPLATGAAALVAMFALCCAAALSDQLSFAAQLIAAMANAVLVISLWSGIISDRRTAPDVRRAD